jgi:SAM-dependent methyltransferase
VTAEQAIPAEHPYLRQLRRHRRAWERKRAVRALYRRWYARMVAQLSPRSPTVEVGCGCGGFKEFYPQAIATDAFPTPWCERVADACRLPFADGEVGNLVLFDVLHHLRRPMAFFAEAARVLAPGGRVVLVEPLITAWSRIVYGGFHHEPYDLNADVLDPPPGGRPGDDYANAATATILFVRRRREFLRRVPALALVRQEPMAWLAYPLTGGFRRFGLLPARAVGGLCRVEDVLLRRLRLRGLAMRILVVLERTT